VPVFVTACILEAAEAQFQAEGLEEEDFSSTDDDDNDEEEEEEDAPIHVLRNAITVLDGTGQGDDKAFNTTFLDKEEDIVDAALTDEMCRDLDITCARAAKRASLVDYRAVGDP